MAGMSNEEVAMNLSSAGFARRCGAAAFKTHWEGASHSVPETRVAVTKSNAPVIDCIFANAPKEGFAINLMFENR